MATELKVPTLGMDMEEATIVRWLVEDGAEVEKGDPVLEIDTDKTSFEVEAPAGGTIRNLRGDAGETVPVGATLAHIAAPGEEIPEPAQEAPKDEHPAPQRRAAPAPSGSPSSSRSDSPDGRKVRASPAARRAAAEMGLAIEDIAGSGPYGRVYLSDVLQRDRAPEPAIAESADADAPTADTPEPVLREPLSRVRRLGAERTARSFSEVPHFYLTRDLDADRLVELQVRLARKLDPAPSLTELMVLAISRTLKNHPRLNARYAGGEIELRPRVNLGMAVATEAGLVVPVLEGADTLPLKDLSRTAKDLVRRAREAALRPEELSGGTFTLSNLGMMGIDSFDAIINTPEAAILAVGRVRTVPEWREEKWVPKRVISGTLSVDHRVADGADGARFLADLQAALTDWELLL